MNEADAISICASLWLIEPIRHDFHNYSFGTVTQDLLRFRVIYISYAMETNVESPLSILRLEGER